MKTSRATLTILAALTVSVMATPAKAALIHFTLTSGTVTGKFTINSAVAPTVYSLGKYVEYKGVEIYFNKFPARPYEVSFFTTASKGGIGIAAPGGGDKSIFAGLQIFSGVLTSPTYSNGTYTLTRVPYGGKGTLTVSGAPLSLLFAAPLGEISAVPLPPGLPLFASALAALGFMGFARRKTGARPSAE